MSHSADTGAGSFGIRHRLAIIFVTLALCAAGVFSAYRMPSSVFPETEFPRCVILIDNGIMPADEMMVTVTRPMEEAMKDIPGVVQVRSATGRGSAEVNVFFNWQVNMIESELFVLNRVAQVKTTLPPTAKTNVWRLTFNAFPIIGVSLTSPKRDLTELWETARERRGRPPDAAENAAWSGWCGPEEWWRERRRGPSLPQASREMPVVAIAHATAAGAGVARLRDWQA